MAASVSKAQIDDFWAQKRIAIIGLSRKPQHFSRGVAQALQRDHTIIAVNPQAATEGAQLDGKPFYTSLTAATEPADAAVIMTKPEKVLEALEDCSAAGVRKVWLTQGEAGMPAVIPQAAQYCQEHNIQLIAGFCPFMFMPNTPFFHRIHTFFVKLSGQYPN